MYTGRILVGWGIESMMPVITTFFAPYYKEDYFVRFIFIIGICSRNELILCSYRTSTLYGIYTLDSSNILNYIRGIFGNIR